MNARELVERAIALESHLTAFGLGVFGHPRDAIERFIQARERLLSNEGLLEVALCAQWLREGHATGERNSYGLKHEVENHYGVYIANGSLIAAALGMGLRYRVERPNVVLALGAEEPAAQHPSPTSVRRAAPRVV